MIAQQTLDFHSAFGTFLTMDVDQNSNPKALERAAVKVALDQNWKDAIEINTEILKSYPLNTNAKLRLGRAYLQTREFKKAIKIFKGVLKDDPINPIAEKNLKLARSEKTEKNNTQADTKDLIKEPGTTIEENIVITAGRITADHFTPGEKLGIKINKKTTNVYKNSKMIGRITSKNTPIIFAAKKAGSEISVSYLSGKDKEIKLIIKSNMPIFRAEKQDVKPYVKKGSIEEPVSLP